MNETDNNIATNSFSWSENNQNNWFVVGKNTKFLPAGFYTVHQNTDGSFCYQHQPVKTDELISFKTGFVNEIMSEIDTFWKNVDIFKQYGFLHRRGYLFYGPPGSGKTAITEQIASNVIANNGISFICRNSPDIFSYGLAYFRKYEPNRKIVCLFEDIDSIIDRYGESELLSCLDGENQIDHVLNIATTNYPENLDKRIINRPRRFDRIVNVGFPDAKIREQYFIKKLKISSTEVKQWVKLSKNFSFAAMTDLVISVKCFNNTLEDAAKKVAITMNKKANSNEF